MAPCFRYTGLIVSVPVDQRESCNVVASLSRAPELVQHVGMGILGVCCVWVFLCGSGSRFQFRVRDFRPRTQKVFCGQEFCGFKLTRVRDFRPRTQTVFCGQEFCGSFRFCDFRTWRERSGFCLEVFCRRTWSFLPKFFAEEIEFILVLAHSHFYRESTF